MTIRISFSDTTVRVAVEINGAVESKVVELPQRTWVGLTDEDDIDWDGGDLKSFVKAIEAKLRSKNNV
jgi:hypothetical protein